MRPEVLFDAETLDRRIDALAAEITADHRGCERLLVIGVLKGAVFFVTDLLKRLDLPVVLDFIQTSSYRDSTEPGEVRIRKDIDLTVRGADVLLIEDIVDTGHTLKTILGLLQFRGARQVRLCTLLDKPSRRQVEVPIDYCGFEIPDHFVVGYGLDYAERYRHLPYVGILPSDG
ncbi:MAG: hypoxanthine phosphoribosyltransferase [Acidobacteriota bacterium]